MGEVNLYGFQKTALDSVAEKIRNIKKATKTTDKIKLLEQYSGDDIFVRILTAAYSESSNFKIQSFKHSWKTVFDSLKAETFTKGYKHFGITEIKDDSLLKVLRIISEQRGITDEDKYHLMKISAITSETYAVVLMVCKKDLDCGINIKTINKAIPDLIRETPYQRCSTMKAYKNIDFTNKAIVQCKANGLFAYCIVNNTNDVPVITFRTRSGSNIHQLEHLKELLLNSPKHLQYGNKKGLLHRDPRSIVLMGELRVFEKDGSIMPRTKGNGILSSCIHGTADPKHLKDIFYTVWDVVNLHEFWRKECPNVYSERFYRASQYVYDVGNHKVLQLIPSKYVSSSEECKEFYREMLRQGEEGAIVKNTCALWKNNTSTDMVKLKPMLECEMKVTGFLPHSKNKDWMGSLLVESEDGLVKTKVGSGFTEADRQKNWQDEIGSIVSIESEGLITDKKKKEYSLYTPVFVEIRHDKDTANTLEEIQDADINPDGRSRNAEEN